MVLDRVVINGNEAVIWRQTDNVGYILHGEGGIREHMISKGVAPRDHIKENKDHIKKMQAKRKEPKSTKLVSKPAQQHRKPVVPTLPLHLIQDENVAPIYCENNSNAICQSPHDLFKTNENFGKVPKYIQKRKIQMAEAKRKESEIQPPPGLRYATAAEKQLALQTLCHNKQVIEGLLKDLPLVADTFGLQRKKDFLDKKMQEIDNSIALYSQPNVCIPTS